MNPVVILTRNNLDLTKRCIESVKCQDIPVEIHVFDNGSTDGTVEWASDNVDSVFVAMKNQGVSRGWNTVLYSQFRYANAEHCLVIGNDTVLAPWTYSALLSVDAPFVTGVDTGMSPLPDKPDVYPLSPHPDFSCFLIRRECWDKVGQFNERLVHYCGDCDLHIRAHRAGVRMVKASIPYNHERSSTMNKASYEDRMNIHQQANLDREEFRAIYDCLPGTPAYDELFK